MPLSLTLEKSIAIDAPIYKVWEALTNPDIIKKYFFGTNCETDWQKGSPILFKGEWEGKPYEDKGTILDIEEGKRIVYNYWSSFSGTEDIPDNYSTIEYLLTIQSDKTIFTIKQDGFKNRETCDHSKANWGHVMEEMRNVVEKHVM